MPKKSLRTQLAAALPFLQALSRMSDAERVSALEFINDDGLAVLQQCIYNCIYNQNIPKKRRAEIRRSLGKEGKKYEYLATDSKNLLKRRRLLKQTGAGLPIILTTVLPLLASLLSSVVRGK